MQRDDYGGRLSQPGCSWISHAPYIYTFGIYRGCEMPNPGELGRETIRYWWVWGGEWT